MTMRPLLFILGVVISTVNLQYSFGFSFQNYVTTRTRTCTAVHVVEVSIISRTIRNYIPTRMMMTPISEGKEEEEEEEVDTVDVDDVDVVDSYSPNITSGRVKNLKNHIRLLDQSLQKSSNGELSLFRYINDNSNNKNKNSNTKDDDNNNDDDYEPEPELLAAPVIIETAKQIDSNKRFGVLSHGTQIDPIYNYGNAASLELFEQECIESLCKTPSRYSTIPELMEDRSQLIQQIEQNGYGYIYDAVRTTCSSSPSNCSSSSSSNSNSSNAEGTTGTLFIIKKVLIWNVYNDNVDNNDKYHRNQNRIGLAALYDRNDVIPYDRTKMIKTK